MPFSSFVIKCDMDFTTALKDNRDNGSLKKSDFCDKGIGNGVTI